MDLLYYGNQRQLEYDLVVEPGADPDAIALSFEGVEELRIDAQGDLLLDTPGGEVRQHKPLVYQEVEGVRREIAGTYVLNGRRRVGFQVAAYDASQPLIIDPVLSYSTYLGGSGDDRGTGIAVDSSGNAYVTGFTSSINFPTANPIQPANGGSFDAFVTKLNAAGNGLVYSTYLGGTDDDYGHGIAVDSSGNAYVGGYTISINFPTASPAQPAFGGVADAFVTKLNAAGNALVYSTYLGGSDFEVGSRIAVDASGNAYVIGRTRSTNFPTVSPIQAAFGGGVRDAFVTKLNAAGSTLVYSTYLGGSADDIQFGFDIAVDAAGNAYITGQTFSTDFPTAGPFQSTNGGGRDVFIAKISDVAAGCTFSIAPTSESFPASGGTGSVAVMAPDGCMWTAASNDSWITIASGESGSGNGTVAYSVAANGSSLRTGTMSIAGQTFTVTQAGTAPVSPLTVSPLSLSFSGSVGDPPAQQALQVGSDAGTVNWTASADLLNGAGWLTVSPASGIATLAQPATVTAEVNFAALAAGVFQAVITVTDTDTGFSVCSPRPGSRDLAGRPAAVGPDGVCVPGGGRRVRVAGADAAGVE